jgi:hypothetical protein
VLRDIDENLDDLIMGANLLQISVLALIDVPRVLISRQIRDVGADSHLQTAA